MTAQEWRENARGGGGDCGEEARGWGLKRRNDRTGGEERRREGSAIIIGYENLAVTSAPLLAVRYPALQYLLTPPPPEPAPATAQG